MVCAVLPAKCRCVCRGIAVCVEVLVCASNLPKYTPEQPRSHREDASVLLYSQRSVVAAWGDPIKAILGHMGAQGMLSMLFYLLSLFRLLAWPCWTGEWQPQEPVWLDV